MSITTAITRIKITTIIKAVGTTIEKSYEYIKNNINGNRKSNNNLKKAVPVG